MLYFVSGLFREHWTIFKINHFWHLSLKKMSSQCRLILILLNHDLSKTIISIQPLFSLHQIRLATFNRKSKIALFTQVDKSRGVKSRLHKATRDPGSFCLCALPLRTSGSWLPICSITRWLLEHQVSHLCSRNHEMQLREIKQTQKLKTSSS